MRIGHSTTASNLPPNKVKGIFNETSADVLIPLSLSDRSRFLTGTYAERFTVRSPATDSIITMHTVLLKLGMSIQHNDRWQGVYMFLPKISSDFEQVDQNHFQIGGLVLMKRRFSSAFTLKFGAYANRDLFGPMFVPLLGAYFERGRWTFNGTLPINAELLYALKQDRFQLGVQFDGINRSYYSNQVLPQYMEKLNNEIGILAQYQQQAICIRLLAGMAIGRRCTFFEAGDEADLAFPLSKVNDSRNDIESFKLDGAMLRLSIHYRLPLTPTTDD